MRNTSSYCLILKTLNLLMNGQILEYKVSVYLGGQSDFVDTTIEIGYN